MARETLKDFLNSIGKSADRISYVQKEGPDGLGVDPNSGEELLNLFTETQGLIGDYLKHLVDFSTNEFKIDGGNELAASSNRGDSLVIAEEQGASNVFVNQGTESASNLNAYSNSGKFDSSGTPLSDIIDKTGKEKTFHRALNEIEGKTPDSSGKVLSNPQGEDNIVVQAAHKMLLNNNRFANVGSESNESFSEFPQNVEDFENFANNRGTINVQNEFGIYSKENHKTSFDRLKNIGKSLLLKSSGFYSENTPGTSETAEILNDSLTDLIQSGDINSSQYSDSTFVKADIENLRPRSAPGFPSNSAGESIRSGKGDYMQSDSNANNSKSFGSKYNSVMTFSSKNRNVHKIQAAIAIIALKNAAKDFYDTFSEYLKNEDKKSLERSTEEYLQRNSKTNVGLYLLGKSRQMTSTALDINLFNRVLTPTIHPYTNCVDRGIEIVFGPDDTKEKVSKHKNVAEAPGFWFAVASSVLKSYDNIVGRLIEIDTASYVGKEIEIVLKEIVENNNFIQFFNVMAIIGDASLNSTNSMVGETESNSVQKTRDVDAMKNTPGNRVGKSRVARPRSKAEKNELQINPFADNISAGDGSITTQNTLAWEQSATPSMYLLPVNMIRAANRLNNSVRGANPMRGMLGSRMVRNTYFSIDVDGSFNRIPSRVVKILEDRLEAEYVPFYFHDLRTNEILSFHAFLTQLTDSINSNFDGVSGYGRADPVQIYNNTTRSLQVGFTVYSTNREDFDEMWYKINKFVTFLYPQYTQGTMVDNGFGNFTQAFSQVMGATPIVRLRVGDVIKSNYSRFGLARLFGIGDKEVNAVPVDAEASVFGLLKSFGASIVQKILNVARDVLTFIYVTAYGSPLGVISFAEQLVEKIPHIGGIIARLGADFATNSLSPGLVNGFANPLIVEDVINNLRDPNVYSGAGQKPVTDAYGAKKTVFIKPDNNVGYYSPDDNKQYYLTKRARGRVLKSVIESDKVFYEVLVVDGAELANGKILHVSHANLLLDPGNEFLFTLAGQLSIIAGLDFAGMIDQTAKSIPSSDQFKTVGFQILRAILQNPESSFMDPIYNPYSRGFETTKGRGLAGVIRGVSFDWLSDFPWETDYNARAPIGCKISFQFDVIHDLPPGLDHSGYNKAPLYNVGEIMRNVAGDPYGDNGAGGESFFKKGGSTRTTGDKKGGE